MAAVSDYLPEQPDLESAHSDEIVRYMSDVNRVKTEQENRLPTLIQNAANAKRDLDIAKAVMRSCDNTIQLCRSVLASRRGQGV